VVHDLGRARDLGRDDRDPRRTDGEGNRRREGLPAGEGTYHADSACLIR